MDSMNSSLNRSSVANSTYSTSSMIFVAVLLTTPTKLVSGYLGGRIYDLDVRRSTRVGLGMVTRGEFTLIIATLALSGAGGTVAESVGETIYAFSVGYVLVMSVLGTTLMQYAAAIERAVVPALERDGHSRASR